MNENVIFFVNYVLYTIANLTEIVYEIKMYTPRYSVKKTFVLSILYIIVSGTIKFFVPVYGKLNVYLAIFNNVMFFVIFKLIFTDKFVRVLFVHALFVSVNIMNSMIWLFLPNGDATNYETGTTLGYLCTIPIMYVQMEIVSRVFMKVQKKMTNIDINTAVLTIVFAAYALSLSDLLETCEIFAYRDSMYATIIAAIITGMVLFIIIIIALAYIKSSEQELKTQLTQLETARSLEEENYHQTLQRIDAMAKLRHDFYGQLQIARYLLDASPGEAKRMLEDMKKQVGTYE